MNEIEARILSEITEEEATTILQKLIQAPSCYPPGNTLEVAQVCKKLFESDQILCDTVSTQPYLPSVLAKIGDGNGKTLVFHAHIDTVPIGQKEKWIFPPFSGKLEDGKIYGRGAGDCKGSAAAQIMAAIAIKRAGIPLHGNLIVACVADEEGGGHFGTKWLRESKQLNPDYLVVGEQTQNQVGIAERGAVWVKITVEGTACHGALPWQGKSAIMRMGEVLREISDWLVPQLEKKRNPYLPKSSLNIGVIQGGLKVNIVPDTCSIEIDRRILPEETCDSVVAEFHETICRTQKRIGMFPYRIEVLSNMDTSVNTSEKEPFVEVVQEASEQIYGKRLPLMGYAQGSDGRWFARDKFPIVIFGPGDPAVAHCDNEFCSAAQLTDAARILALTAVKLLA